MRTRFRALSNLVVPFLLLLAACHPGERRVPPAAGSPVPGAIGPGFFDGFDGTAVRLDAEGVSGWATSTGEGNAIVEFVQGGPEFASIRVDATSDRRNVWWAVISRRVSEGMDLSLLGRPGYALRIEARIRTAVAPRRVNLSLNTQRTTDFHSNLMEFDLPDAETWYTISLTIPGFDARPGDRVNGQMALMDWGLGKYRVDVDYFRVDLVRTAEAGPDKGEPVPYHPPVADPKSFALALPVVEDGVVDLENPGANLGRWYVRDAGPATAVVTAGGPRSVILRWDLKALAGKKAARAGLLELTTRSLHRTADEIADFGLVRVVEILGGDPGWEGRSVTWDSLCRGRDPDLVLNPQMIIDWPVTEGAGGKTYLTIPKPVLQRLIDGRTKGIAVRPLGAIEASFDSIRSGAGAARLLLDVRDPDPSQMFPVVPRPSSVAVGKGHFALGPSTRIFVPPGDMEARDTAQWFSGFIERVSGHPLTVGEIESPSGAAPRRSIKLVRDESPELGGEGYRLSVARDGIEVKAANAAGFFYAFQTLRQLLPPELERADAPVSGSAVDLRLPCLEAVDRPVFGWRGLMLDCSRTFLTKDDLRRTIDLLALYKLNVLHLHLTDDQGWRLEIRSRPGLSALCSSFSDRFPGERGGFYTQADMKEIVAYARARHITVVPEIEMPGHSSEVFVAYPELSCSGRRTEIYPYLQGPPVTADILCAGNGETFRFVEDVLDEVLEIFPSEYIHIGGDEAPKDRWRACPKCQARIGREGLKDEDALQSWFVARVETFLNSRGRKLIGWDEILEGGLAPRAAVMSWRSSEGGLRAARAGHPAVMSPTSHCYFDYDYAAIPLDKVYAFDPVPDGLGPAEARLILGGQANMWTHIARAREPIDRQIFPRLLGLAEALWTEKTAKDLDDFHRRMTGQELRLEALGVSLGPGR